MMEEKLLRQVSQPTALAEMQSISLPASALYCGRTLMLYRLCLTSDTPTKLFILPNQSHKLTLIFKKHQQCYGIIIKFNREFYTNFERTSSHFFATMHYPFLQQKNTFLVRQDQFMIFESIFIIDRNDQSVYKQVWRFIFLKVGKEGCWIYFLLCPQNCRPCSWWYQAF